MGKSDLEFVAGGGLIDRRSFLRSGLGFTVAALQLPSAIAADAVPSWMRAPGSGDSPYGSPPSHEQDVQKWKAPGHPLTQSFTLWHSPLAHQRGVITPSGLHFGIHHNGIPEIDPAQHALFIHGLVNQPLRFDFERLMRYPFVSRIQFLECAGNTGENAVSPIAQDKDCTELFGQLSCSEWTGIPVSLLLKEAGVKDTAKWVIVEGADAGSHARSLPLSKLMDDAIIALYQNGERLRRPQGYPMRLFVPGWEGNVNIKWVHRLEVTDAPAYTKDESGLYTDSMSDGKIRRFSFPMEVKSVITRPSGKQQLTEPKGYYEVAGFAWSGRGKISRVDVSADGGKTWAPARLHEPALDKAFTQFSIPWQWNGSSALLLSRATDEHGNVQPTRKEWKKLFAAHSFSHYNAIQAWKVGRDGRVSNAFA